MSRNAPEMDMLNGPLLPKIIRFSLPLAATGILSLLFNAADVIVVGKFAGANSLAAVGATSALINLLVGLFINISVGVNILVARYIGCRQEENASRVIHCSYALSALLGILLMVTGLILSPVLLRLMDTPEELLPLSDQYLRIYFIGIPFQLMYQFGAAVLRAFGDTKRPLYFLTISGVVNVILNLFFVIVCHLDVAGVAIATSISQFISFILVTVHLMHRSDFGRLELKKIRLYKSETLHIIQIGLPMGFQSICFNIANVTIQGAINGFGSSIVAANTAEANIEGFIYTAMNSVFHAAITFSSQNLGAGRLDRIPKVYRNSMITVLGIGISMCALSYFFCPQLLTIYVSKSDPAFEDIVAYGIIRNRNLGVIYFLCGVMEVSCGMVRGLGKTWTPMIVSALGACVLRIVWLSTVFQAVHTLPVVYQCYFVSFIVTATAHFICYKLAYRKLKEKTAELAARPKHA